jgi:hypothetical protein
LIGDYHASIFTYAFTFLARTKQTDDTLERRSQVDFGFVSICSQAFESTTLILLGIRGTAKRSWDHKSSHFVYCRLTGSFPASTAGLVLGSVQLAFARQDAKEHWESDDGWRRLDDSYSPRRHWCSSFKPDGEAWVRGLRTDV